MYGLTHCRRKGAGALRSKIAALLDELGPIKRRIPASGTVAVLGIRWKLTSTCLRVSICYPSWRLFSFNFSIPLVPIERPTRVVRAVMKEYRLLYCGGNLCYKEASASHSSN